MPAGATHEAWPEGKEHVIVKPVTEMSAAGWSAAEATIDSAMSESPMMAETYDPSVTPAAGMPRPLVLLDFDGVVNQFPEDKVRCRQNSTGWMRPGDPRIALYSPGNWFIPDRRETVNAGRHGRMRILWSSELVSRLAALDADVVWLSTWQPYTRLLDVNLEVPWTTERWYDPVTREGRHTGKRRTVIDRLRQGRPLVWVDDEETTYEAGLALNASEPVAPVLAVGPDARIGISRSQMASIERFVTSPPAEPSVRFEVTSEAHERHWGF